MSRKKRVAAGLLLLTSIVIMCLYLPRELGIGLSAADAGPSSPEPVAAGQEGHVIAPSKKRGRSARQYTVECRVIGKSGPRNMTIDVPKLIVQDGYGTSVFDTVEQPVVVGNGSDGPITPVTRTLTTGTKVDVMVYGNGKERAFVDISVEFSGKAAAPAKKGRVQWRTLRERVIDCVKLGRPISASLEGFDLAFVVDEVCSDE